ncbi:CAP domain-containing protein [Oerskovia sp. M15]
MPALAPDSQLAGVAQAWAERMAANGAMSHNPSTGSQIRSGWSSWGENVAWSSDPSPSGLHTSLMDSSGHRANILSVAFTSVGSGTRRTPPGRLRRGGLRDLRRCRSLGGAPAQAESSAPPASSSAGSSRSRPAAGPAAVPRPVVGLVVGHAAPRSSPSRSACGSTASTCRPTACTARPLPRRSRGSRVCRAWPQTAWWARRPGRRSPATRPLRR